jgi:hypothetical protein
MMEVIIGSKSYLGRHQPQKVTVPHFMGSTRLQHSKSEVLFF